MVNDATNVRYVSHCNATPSLTEGDLTVQNCDLCHKFQRRMLGISCNDEVRNEVRQKTTLQTLEFIIKERRLR